MKIIILKKIHVLVFAWTQVMLVDFKFHKNLNLFLNLKAGPSVTLKRQVRGIFVQDWIEIQIDPGSLHLPTVSAATPRLMWHSRNIMMAQIQEDHLPVIADNSNEHICKIYIEIADLIGWSFLSLTLERSQSDEFCVKMKRDRALDIWLAYN